MAGASAPKSTDTVNRALNIISRISTSSRKAQPREHSPAGRSSSTMPSGVSAGTIVSSTAPVTRSPAASGLDDHGARDLVVQALAGFPEDHQGVDQPVHIAHDRDERGNRVHHVTQQEYAPE